jgi:hypothetical protein
MRKGARQPQYDRSFPQAHVKPTNKPEQLLCAGGGCGLFIGGGNKGSGTAWEFCVPSPYYNNKP